jgi:hypothetical protein
VRNNALYFPFISIPNTSWTIRTLLYWDRLSSIVPLEYACRPGELDNFMRQLLDAGLVTPVSPAAHLHRLENFESAFSELLDAKLKLLDRSRDGGRPRPRMGIHVEKLGRIPELLIDRGIAEAQGASWYSVDEPVARLFMAYLAVCLGGLDDVDAAPVTNRWEYARLFGYGTAARRGKAPEHHHARSQIIECLLPVPDEPVTLSQLVEFKEKHGRLLPALRTKIEAQSAQIAMLLDPEDRADATQDFVNDCRLHVEELCEAMRFSWKTLAFGTLVPLAGSGLQWASTAPESRMAFAGTALSFTAAVFAAFSSIGGLNDIQSRQPLAYIAYARKRFSPNFQIG